MYASLPNLNSLKVFEAAARHSSFKLAAGELNLTPTAISHRVRGLEEQIGGALFERRVREIRLTPLGTSLFAECRRAFLGLDTLLSEHRAANARIQVSMTPAFAALWMAPRLTRFSQAHPGVEVAIQASHSMAKLDGVDGIDLVIRYGRCPPEADAHRLAQETFGMFASADYIARYPQLAECTLIETQWQNPGLREVSWQTTCPELAGTRKLSFRDEQQTIQAAVAGQGVALASNILVRDFLDRGWLAEHPQSLSVAGHEYYLLGSKYSYKPAQLETFRAWVYTEMTAAGGRS